MSAEQILWLVIDIVMGFALLIGVGVFVVVLIMGRSGSTSKKPKKNEIKKKNQSEQ